MTATLTMSAEQNQGITRTVNGERARLQRFIRRYVDDRNEAEDILQDVFSELVDAYRLMQPIEQAGAWLIRVARKRIIDRFRKRRHETQPQPVVMDAEGEAVSWDELLPASEGGPEAAFARQVLVEQIEQAISELPAMQREVFIAHELNGRSFKQLSAELGVSVNALLSRKHAAVTTLRQRLREVYQEFDDFAGE